jgi:lipoprotein-anchoring transpeptidase ErfK/SrfK
MFKRIMLFVVIVIGGALLAAAARASTQNVVPFSGYQPGTIVVKTSERKLYFVIGPDRALRFPVGVGRRGKTWTGRAVIDSKRVQPAWQAPPEIWGNRPGPPPVIPGGAPNNPIHGTNNPASVGGFVSSGCIRMYNQDIRALYQMVSVGTPVVIEQ